MATEDQVAVARRGGGTYRMTKAITLTMAAGASVSDSTFTPPLGSTVQTIRYHTGTTFTGSPTNINLTIGKTDGGTDYVSTLDIKTANAPTACTLVAAADYSNWPAQAVFLKLAAVGGTNPAGTVVVYIDYSAPNF